MIDGQQGDGRPVLSRRGQLEDTLRLATVWGVREPKPESVAVGKRIRGLRHDASMTLRELAERTGLSQPYLSQLEKGIAAPSIVTLYSLSEVFGVPPGDFLEDRHVEQAVDGEFAIWVTDPDDRQRIDVSGGMFEPAENLIPGGVGAGFEAYIHTFRPGDEDREWFEHPGQDFIYVLDGEIELQIRGRDGVRLRRGQSVLHSGEVSHRCRALGADAARIILVSRRD